MHACTHVLHLIELNSMPYLAYIYMYVWSLSFPHVFVLYALYLQPTNHLDLHALLWLQSWINNEFSGIALIVSHDECFLNEICTDILELRSVLGGQKKGSLTHFSGDYNSYQQILSEKKIAIRRELAAIEMQKEKLKEFVSREGKKFDSMQHQAQRKSKLKKLEALNKVDLEDIEDDSAVSLSIPEPTGVFDSSERLISVENVSFGWPSGSGDQTTSSPLFDGVDFCVFPGARIGIVGKNGSGKTSLLDLLTGDLTPTAGQVRRHPGAIVTILQQHHYKGDQLSPDISPLEHLRLLPFNDRTAIGVYDLGTRQEETAHRAYLSDFGLVGPRAMIPVKYLSGGQKMRVAMAVALYQRPDVLILDEVRCANVF